MLTFFGFKTEKKENDSNYEAYNRSHQYQTQMKAMEDSNRHNDIVLTVKRYFKAYYEPHIFIFKR